MSTGPNKWAVRANKWAQRSAWAKWAVRSKRVSEQCEQTSKQMSEWPSTQRANFIQFQLKVHCLFALYFTLSFACMLHGACSLVYSRSCSIVELLYSVLGVLSHSALITWSYGNLEPLEIGMLVVGLSLVRSFVRSHCSLNRLLSTAHSATLVHSFIFSLTLLPSSWDRGIFTSGFQGVLDHVYFFKWLLYQARNHLSEIMYPRIHHSVFFACCKAQAC